MQGRLSQRPWLTWAESVFFRNTIALVSYKEPPREVTTELTARVGELFKLVPVFEPKTQSQLASAPTVHLAGIVHQNHQLEWAVRGVACDDSPRACWALKRNPMRVLACEVRIHHHTAVVAVRWAVSGLVRCSRWKLLQALVYNRNARLFQDLHSTDSLTVAVADNSGAV